MSLRNTLRQQALRRPTPTSTDSIWITDDLLNSVTAQFAHKATISRQHGRRFGFNTVGTLESRRRVGKRRMTYAPMHIQLPGPWSIFVGVWQSILRLPRPYEQWRWEAPAAARATALEAVQEGDRVTTMASTATEESRDTTNTLRDLLQDFRAAVAREVDPFRVQIMCDTFNEHLETAFTRNEVNQEMFTYLLNTLPKVFEGLPDFHGGTGSMLDRLHLSIQAVCRGISKCPDPARINMDPKNLCQLYDLMLQLQLYPENLPSAIQLLQSLSHAQLYTMNETLKKVWNSWFTRQLQAVQTASYDSNRSISKRKHANTQALLEEFVAVTLGASLHLSPGNVENKIWGLIFPYLERAQAVFNAAGPHDPACEKFRSEILNVIAAVPYIPVPLVARAFRVLYQDFDNTCYRTLVPAPSSNYISVPAQLKKSVMDDAFAQLLLTLYRRFGTLQNPETISREFTDLVHRSPEISATAILMDLVWERQAFIEDPFEFMVKFLGHTETPWHTVSVVRWLLDEGKIHVRRSAMTSLICRVATEDLEAGSNLLLSWSQAPLLWNRPKPGTSLVITPAVRSFVRGEFPILPYILRHMAQQSHYSLPSLWAVLNVTNGALPGRRMWSTTIELIKAVALWYAESPSRSTRESIRAVTDARKYISRHNRVPRSMEQSPWHMAQIQESISPEMIQSFKQKSMNIVRRERFSRKQKRRDEYIVEAIPPQEFAPHIRACAMKYAQSPKWLAPEKRRWFMTAAIKTNDLELMDFVDGLLLQKDKQDAFSKEKEGIR